MYGFSPSTAIVFSPVTFTSLSSGWFERAARGTVAIDRLMLPLAG